MYSLPFYNLHCWMLCINMYWQGTVVAEYWVHSASQGECVNEVTEARKTIMRVFFVTLWKKENRNKVSTKWRLWRTYSFIILNKVQTSCYLIVKFQNESIWYSTFKHSFNSDNNPPNLVELTDEFKMKVLINSKQSLNNIIYGTEQHKFYCQIMFFYVHLRSVFFVFLELQNLWSFILFR